MSKYIFDKGTLKKYVPMAPQTSSNARSPKIFSPIQTQARRKNSHRFKQRLAEPRTPLTLTRTKIYIPKSNLICTPPLLSTTTYCAMMSCHRFDVFRPLC